MNVELLLQIPAAGEKTVQIAIELHADLIYFFISIGLWYLPPWL